MRLLAFLRRRRSRHSAGPIESERLLRIYRETHREMTELRRAA